MLGAFFIIFDLTLAKAKTTYFCQNCGAQSAKWVGKCPSCGEWNTYVEEIIQKESKNSPVPAPKSRVQKAMPIGEVQHTHEERFLCSDNELNRVLGGGIVSGSVVLIGGEPGIGKSTLMLQVALSLNTKKVLYISGEESANQIKLRADRVGKKNDNCFLLTETDTSNIFHQFKEVQPEMVVIDSIQTLQSPLVESAAGSVSQIRQCTAELIRFAKENNVPVFLVGHITKEGSLAGPKVLEHMVDTVLQFEGDRHLAYRILRTTKNRFGSTSELGIYEMLGAGLREVSNPSEILLSQRNERLSGIAIGATLEGNRPLLIEIQALVSPTSYGNPQRSSTGFDSRRLQMLLAVLEKRGGFKLSQQDVFLNVAGGIKVEDPAMDLAVCVSLISSYEEVVMPTDVAFAAEIGLGGEVRAVNRIENRISEAAKLGFRKIFISKNNMKGIEQNKFDITIIPVAMLTEVTDSLV